jgi:hypothetical protein
MLTGPLSRGHFSQTTHRREEVAEGRAGGGNCRNSVEREERRWKGAEETLIAKLKRIVGLVPTYRVKQMRGEGGQRRKQRGGKQVAPPLYQILNVGHG